MKISGLTSAPSTFRLLLCVHDLARTILRLGSAPEQWIKVIGNDQVKWTFASGNSDSTEYTIDQTTIHISYVNAALLSALNVFTTSL